MKLEVNFNQSGVIPYRKQEDVVEILLITSIKKKKWIIPKGYIEFNLSPFESAKKEAFEEAGVIGSNETVELGSYDFKKGPGKCNMKIYSMEVIKEYEDYPEKNMRKRKWFQVDEAIDKIQIPEVAEMMRNFDKSIEVN